MTSQLGSPEISAVTGRSVLDHPGNTQAKEVTEESHHPCRHPRPIDPRTLEVSLFPPIDQMGAPRGPDPAADPALGVPAGAAGRDRLAAHKMLQVQEFTAVLHSPGQVPATTVSSAPVPRPVWDWVAANEKKKAATAALSPLTDVLDDIHARTTNWPPGQKCWRFRDAVPVPLSTRGANGRFWRLYCCSVTGVQAHVSPKA